MNTMLKSTFAAAALALSLSALSANPASADCGLPHGGMSTIENSGDGYYEPKNKRRGGGRLGRMLGDRGPSYGILEGGVRMMILLDNQRKAGKKRDCKQIKREIAGGERRLAEMNSRLDYLFSELQLKKNASTSADIGATADAALSLNQGIKDMERALKKLRKKLAKCQNGQ